MFSLSLNLLFFSLRQGNFTFKVTKDIFFVCGVGHLQRLLWSCDMLQTGYVKSIFVLLYTKRVKVKDKEQV